VLRLELHLLPYAGPFLSTRSWRSDFFVFGLPVHGVYIHPIGPFNFTQYLIGFSIRVCSFAHSLGRKRPKTLRGHSLSFFVVLFCASPDHFISLIIILHSLK
jgi:hypothetical protein